MATPHTRGSTPIVFVAIVEVGGYPAYAGIDLRRLRQASARGRLPRIRGDRPLYRYDIEGDVAATPHTRGSTPSISLGAERNGGYPAYAGIDP